MSLSEKAQKALNNAAASKTLGQEISDAIDAQGSGPADAVTAIGVTSDLSASAAALSTSDTYTDAAVNSAIDDAVDALAGEVEARMDVIEAKIDEVIAALKAADLMSS